MTQVSITALRKKTADGRLYTRPKEIEAMLVSLQSFPWPDVVRRCAISERKEPDYIPSECLLNFLRARRSDPPDEAYETIFKALAERILRTLPCLETRDDRGIILRNSNIRDAVFGRFVELLAADRREYSEQLDFFEVRFDCALKALKFDAQEAIAAEPLSTPLQDAETGEIAGEVERAAGLYDPFERIYAADYRMRLDTAIETLPQIQRAIIEMLRKGIPIDSEDPSVLTISKALGKSEKTIRNQRDKAFSTLRVILKDGELP